MKPTAPLRCNLSVFATAPCRGLSLSRWSHEAAGEVRAEKAKTARRRIIRIQPNLAAWLAPYGSIGGAVVPVNPRKKLDAVRRAAGLKRWSKNGLRHSFASYRLAATNDAATVASELGHSTSQMLYSTYREVVRPEEAERYWKISPAEESGKVVAFAANNSAKEQAR